MNCSLLFYFSLLLTLKSSFSQLFLPTSIPTQTPCSSFGRAEVCPAKYEPVCASYSKYCTDPECFVKNFMNSCFACQDLAVYGYIPGPCSITSDQDQEEYLIGEEEEIFTDDADVFSDTDIDVTSHEDNQEEPLRDNFDVIVYCGGERPTACANIDNPVCVIGCLSGECKRTVKNDCLACSDPDVWTYSPGKCEKEKIPCTESSSNLFENICDGEWNPVCAHPKGCISETCASTVTNGCTACVFSQADYYTMGECSKDLNSQ